MMTSVLEQSLLVYPLILGIYLSYDILKTTDLTVEGSFVLGAALYARVIIHMGVHSIAIISAFLGGALCGIMVALMQRKNRMNSLLAGIIMVFMLYSINLNIMGKPNINLLSFDLFSNWKGAHQFYAKQCFLCLIGIVISIGLCFLLKTRTGLKLRAFGYKPSLLIKYNQSPEVYRMLGLSFSNGLAALCGALTAQFSGYTDIHMGTGIALMGIGSVVIGQHIAVHLWKHQSDLTITPRMIACFLGGALYFLATHILLFLDINPIHVRLFLGVILMMCLNASRFSWKGTR